MIVLGEEIKFEKVHGNSKEKSPRKPLSKKNQAILRNKLPLITDRYDWMLYFFNYSRSYIEKASKGMPVSKRAGETLRDTCKELSELVKGS